LQPADHQCMEFCQGDPKVLLMAELHARARTLQERCPGARVQAPHQKGAQPDCRPSHYQLDGVKLAHAS
jgi:hypothetical protein